VRFVTREATVHAVNGVSFQVRPGEVLCILGESGSGKSVTLRALMRLLPPRRTQIEGSVRVEGEDVLAMPRRALRDLRGGLVAMAFQEPMTALDPVYICGVCRKAAASPRAVPGGHAIVASPCRSHAFPNPAAWPRVSQWRGRWQRSDERFSA